MRAAAVIFDLDNCLSAGREVPERIYQPGFDAIRQANDGLLTEAQLASAFEDAWRLAIDDVAERHKFSAAMKDAAMKAFAKMEMDEPMHGYPDLHHLRDIDARHFLVTSGFRRLQESKITALGIASWFDEIIIDAIDEPGQRGKEGIFRDLLQQQSLKPRDVLVVGDNPHSEIAAGNRLGCRTIQILRPGVKRGETAWHHIQSLDELLTLIAGA
jgi:FMN phosphatase YigB (HAD superfamily)